MLSINVENMTDLTVVECKGRIISSDAVFKLRDAVMSHPEAHVIALDLSAVQAIGGGALGMLAFLDHWAHDHQAHLKLFNPSRPVVQGLVDNRSILNFEIATFHEMMSMLTESDRQYSLAA
jgi:anti-anti-sigma regulatory factor